MELRQNVSVIQELRLSTLVNGMSAVSGGSADYTAEAYQLCAEEEAFEAEHDYLCPQTWRRLMPRRAYGPF